MKKKVSNKLLAMEADYKEVTGKGFNYFFCPILYVDHDTELCKAHIINKAFSATAKSWTIQRKDVDGFYGRNFEAEFLKIEYKINQITPEQVIVNDNLAKKFKPKIFIDGEEEGYYFTSGKIPDYHSPIKISDQKNKPLLVLKTHPSTIQNNIEIEVNIDFRLSAVVSLIKAGFLTLFEMLGYRYSMSPGGKLIGRDVLGEFYKKNKNNVSKDLLLANAKDHFEKYVNLVRPVEAISLDINGTCKDKMFLLCENNNVVWACIVFIKISDSLHAVLMPLYECQEGEAKFHLFLESPKEITAKLGTFDGHSWHLLSNSQKMHWPDNEASLYN